jgi:DNA-binding LacI/PurR family transcriptional regulator
MARATLQTIADRVGVSRMTVSNAFSRPDQLSAELRDRILAVADALGYVGPNPAARALAKGVAGNVGVLLSDSLTRALTDHVAVSFVSAVAEEIGPSGRALTLLTTSGTDVVPARDVAMDGAIVYSCIQDASAIGWLRRRELPIVFVDHDAPAGYPSVNVDDRAGADAAASHLLSLGHRHIAIATTGYDGDFGELESRDYSKLAHVERQRLRGWTEPLIAAGLDPVVIRLPHGDPIDDGHHMGQLLLARSPRPTAVLCFSDAVAAGVYRAASDAGLRVPGDLSVVGFDDSRLARQLQPELTTVRQDVAAKGRLAAEALTAAIERTRAQGGKPAAGRPKSVVLPTELVVRASTAPPHARGRSR